MNPVASRQIEKEAVLNIRVGNIWIYLKSLLGQLFFSTESVLHLTKKNSIFFPLLGLLTIVFLINILPILKLGYGQFIRQDFEQNAAAGYMTQAEVEKAVRTIEISFTPTGLISTFVISEFLGICVFILLIALCLKVNARLSSSPVKFKQLLSLGVNSWLAVLTVYVGAYAITLLLQEPANVKISQRMITNLGAVLNSLSEERIFAAMERLTSWIDIFFIWKISIVLFGYRLLVPEVRPLSAAPALIIPIVLSVMADVLVFGFIIL